MLKYRGHSVSAVSDNLDEDQDMAKAERVTDLRPARPGAEEAMLCGIGRLICGWGTLEARLEKKIAQLRQSAGEVRMTAARQRPTMAKLMAELRAIVSMRNRRNNVELVTISEIERVLQQVDKFRMLIIQGFQAAAQDGRPGTRTFLCRDAKNNVVSVSLSELEAEIARLEECRDRLLAL